MKTLDTFAQRDFDHYAANGENSSFVTHTGYNTSGRGPMSRTVAKLCFRKGREDENEAVQLSINVAKHFESGRTTEQFASVAFTPEMWAAIVKFVEENRDVRRVRFDEQQQMTEEAKLRVGLV